MQVVPDNSHDQARPTLSVLLHVGFVLTGVVNTMLGPLLPILAGRWNLNDAQAGRFFTAQFTGSMIGVFASSFFASRKGSRFNLILGFLTMGLGSATLVLGSRALGLAAAFCFGTGLGLTIPTTNLLISDFNPSRRASALNLVNFSWGLGAVLCPFVVAALQHVNRSAYLLYGVAALLTVLAVAVASKFPPLRNTQHFSPLANSTGALWGRWIILILGLIFFLYVGTEAAVGGWTASYARRVLMPGSTTWAMMPSFFWAALLFGRFLAPWGLRQVPELVMARGGLGLAALGIIALHSATNASGVAIAVAITGLGLSSVFPIAIAALSHQFGEEASRVAGLMFALAGLGGATLPGLVGYSSNWHGSLRFGLIVPLCGCLAMLLLYAFVRDPVQNAVAS